MEKRQVDLYNMLHAVENHFDSNMPIWSSNIPVSEIKTDFSDILGQLATTAVDQSINSSGATQSKVSLRKDLEEKGLFVSSVLTAYINVHPDLKELYKTVHFTKSDFKNFRDEGLLVAIERLDVGATTIIEGLGAFGVTQAVLDDMMDARDAFFQMMNRQVEVTSTRKTATESVANLLHEAVSILENRMDPMMMVFKTTQPQFYDVYFNDRKIHHTGARAMSLVTTTMNAGTNTPLEGAYLEVVGKGIKRISNFSGQNRVQNLQEGNYTLSVNCLNYVPQMIPFSVMSGQTTQIIIEMQGVLN